jgi:hypothetical protein
MRDAKKVAAILPVSPEKIEDDRLLREFTYFQKWVEQYAEQEGIPIEEAADALKTALTADVEPLRASSVVERPMSGLDDKRQEKLDSAIEQIAKEYTYGDQQKAVKDFIELLVQKAER